MISLLIANNNKKVWQRNANDFLQVQLNNSPTCIQKPQHQLFYSETKRLNISIRDPKKKETIEKHFTGILYLSATSRLLVTIISSGATASSEFII